MTSRGQAYRIPFVDPLEEFGFPLFPLGAADARIFLPFPGNVPELTCLTGCPSHTDKDYQLPNIVTGPAGSMGDQTLTSKEFICVLREPEGIYYQAAPNGSRNFRQTIFQNSRSGKTLTTLKAGADENELGWL